MIKVKIHTIDTLKTKLNEIQKFFEKNNFDNNINSYEFVITQINVSISLGQKSSVFFIYNNDDELVGLVPFFVKDIKLAGFKIYSYVYLGEMYESFWPHMTLNICEGYFSPFFLFFEKWIKENNLFGFKIRNFKHETAKLMYQNLSSVMPLSYFCFSNVLVLNIQNFIDFERNNTFKRVKRYKNKLYKEHNISEKIAKTKKELIASIDALYKFHSDMFNGESSFELNPIISSEFKLRCEMMFSRGELIVSLIKNESEIIAVDFAFVKGRKIFSYTCGYSKDYKKYRIGSIQIYNLCLHAINKSYDLIDFMVGEQDYKKKITNHYLKNIDMFFIRKSLLGSIYNLYSRFLKRLYYRFHLS